MILQANTKVMNNVYNSWHYLGCPHQKFNEDLNSIYRQGVFNNRSIEYMYQYLTEINYPKPYETSVKLSLFYQKVTFKEFNILNVSSYINGQLPSFIQRLDDEINLFHTTNKTYYPFSGIILRELTYQFKNVKYV